MADVDWWARVSGAVGAGTGIAALVMSLLGHIRQNRKDAEEQAAKEKRLAAEVDVKMDLAVPFNRPHFLATLILDSESDIGIARVVVTHPNYSVRLNVENSSKEGCLLSKENGTVTFTLEGDCPNNFDRIDNLSVVKLLVYSTSSTKVPIKEETQITDPVFRTYIEALDDYYAYHHYDRADPSPEPEPQELEIQSQQDSDRFNVDFNLTPYECTRGGNKDIWLAIDAVNRGQEFQLDSVSMCWTHKRDDGTLEPLEIELGLRPRGAAKVTCDKVFKHATKHTFVFGLSSVPRKNINYREQTYIVYGLDGCPDGKTTDALYIAREIMSYSESYPRIELRSVVKGDIVTIGPEQLLPRLAKLAKLGHA